MVLTKDSSVKRFFSLNIVLLLMASMGQASFAGFQESLDEFMRRTHPPLPTEGRSNNSHPEFSEYGTLTRVYLDESDPTRKAARKFIESFVSTILF